MPTCQAIGKTVRIHFRTQTQFMVNMVESLTCSILHHIRVMPKRRFKDGIIDGHGLRQLVSGGSRLVLYARPRDKIWSSRTLNESREQDRRTL